jgi:hypothetical protein
MTFQLSLSNGARWRLIEINDVLFAVLKYRAQQLILPVVTFDFQSTHIASTS